MINFNVNPDTSPTGEGWAGMGLMWDDTESEDQSVEFTVDGPIMKCMEITYNSSAPYFVDCPTCPLNDTPSILGSRLQTVVREICVYKDIPAVFENFNMLGVYPSGQPPVDHTIVQSAYPTVPLQIYNLDTFFWDNFGLDGEGSGITSDRAVWQDSFGIWYNLSSDFDYHLDLRDTVSSDAYISDFWTSFRDIFAQMPDSTDLEPESDLLDFETIVACTPENYETAFIDNHGSMRYYASSWIQSGTSANCEGTTDHNKVFGETCGSGTDRGKVEMSLGIQRTGSHLLKFSTVEEMNEVGGAPDVVLKNSMGGEARVVEPFKCDITNNVLSCVMDKDEKDIELNLDRQGYVINCMVDQDNYQELNTRYFNPYIMPMSWEVQFDILVNPYIDQPVPIFVEERLGSLAATTCGDWICQENERCYTCPADCPPVSVQFEPEVNN
jgi:hypothetical protein